eukprot:scaffold15_cov234-Pinguiococcus_pyrenoidosus.AAC.10
MLAARSPVKRRHSDLSWRRASGASALPRQYRENEVGARRAQNDHEEDLEASLDEPRSWCPADAHLSDPVRQPLGEHPGQRKAIVRVHVPEIRRPIAGGLVRHVHCAAELDLKGQGLQVVESRHATRLVSERGAVLEELVQGGNVVRLVSVVVGRQHRRGESACDSLGAVYELDVKLRLANDTVRRVVIDRKVSAVVVVVAER